MSSSLSAQMKKDFALLQEKLVTIWGIIGSNDLGGEVQAENTVVVIPSLTVDIEFTSSAQQGYEERLLFLLFLLRQPNLRMIFVTSLPIDQEVVDYYLNLIPGIVAGNARKRLKLVSPEDGSSRPLTTKILARPRLIKRIRSLIPDFDRAHMVPFNTTDLERELALKLGIPMYAADPQFFAFGTKSGGRRIFAEERVPYPLGYEDINSLDELVQAMAGIRAERPGVQRVIVKLNEGVSGIGNAVVDVNDLPQPGDPSESERLTQRINSMTLELGDITVEDYLEKLTEGGAIVEEYISGTDYKSPSTQLRVTPLGEVEMLSTHDQMLGGPSGQSYLGAAFPADPDYSWLIMREAKKVGERFAKEGIVGRFALDFVTVRNTQGEWDVYAIEVNLRKGGTTAPYLILQYLTDGAYDAESGLFSTAQGHPKYYIASDHVERHEYQVFTTSELFDIVSQHRLHYDHTTQTGIVFHMISGVGEMGKVGITAIHNSPAEAHDLYDRFVSLLDSIAGAALKEI